jgi:hypothetical protein
MEEEMGCQALERKTKGSTRTHVASPQHPREQQEEISSSIAPSVVMIVLEPICAGVFAVQRRAIP